MSTGGNAEAQWLCANCGARHESNDPPCRNCAGEQFARLEPSATSRVEESNAVAWICEDCGTKAPRNNSPCKKCGGFNYARLADSAPAGGFEGGVPTQTGSGDDSGRHTEFYIGAVLAVIGVLIFPYFFFLVAIPESIAGMTGRSIQNALGKDAQDNPFLSGTFLIMRWFGNFLIFAFVLGILLGIMLILLG